MLSFRSIPPGVLHRCTSVACVMVTMHGDDDDADADVDVGDDDMAMEVQTIIRSVTKF